MDNSSRATEGNMPAFDGYRVKDRSGKVNRRRDAMKVNGKGVFTIQATIAKRGREASAKLAVRRAK